MTNAFTSALRMSAAAAFAAAALSTTAHAEYRCAHPERLTSAEARACELARQDSPEALIRFVNRTRAIYALYLDDFVSQADEDHWELAKRRSGPDSSPVAKAKSEMKSD